MREWVPNEEVQAQVVESGTQFADRLADGGRLCALRPGRDGPGTG